MMFFFFKIRKKNLCYCFRYWIKEEDFFKYKFVLDLFLKYDYKDKFNR